MNTWAYQRNVLILPEFHILKKIGTQEVKNDCFTTQKSLKENSVEIYEIKAYLYISGMKIF
jgi:hypothetical protein